MTRDEPFSTDETSEHTLTLARALLLPRIVIENTEPVLDAGQHAVKGTVGEQVTVTSKVFADGHDVLAVRLSWRRLQHPNWHEVPMTLLGNDSWEGRFTVSEVGRHLFMIEAWIDQYASYCYELEKKFAAGVDVGLELEEGRRHLMQSAERSSEPLRAQLEAVALQLSSLPAQAGVELLAQRQHLRAGLGDIQVHRVQPLDGGQRGVLPGRDQRTRGHAGGADATVDGRGHPRVVEVDAGGLQCSARGNHVGLRLLQCRGGIVGVLLAGCIHAG